MFTNPLNIPNPIDLITKNLNYILFTLVKIINPLLDVGLIVVCIVFLESSPGAIGMILLMGCFIAIFSECSKLIDSKSLPGTLGLLSGLHLVAMLCMLAAASKNVNAVWLTIELCGSAGATITAYLIAYNANPESSDDIENANIVKFWNFFIFYKRFLGYKKLDYFKDLEYLYSEKIKEETVGQILYLPKLLEMFQLQECNNEIILKLLANEISILMSDYFGIHDVMIYNTATIADILNFKVKEVPNKEYLAIIDYLIESRRFLKFLTRAHIFNFLASNQIEKTSFGPQPEEHCFKQFGLIFTSILKKPMGTNSNEGNLDDSSELTFNAGKIAVNLLNMLRNPRNEKRLFSSSNNTKEYIGIASYKDFHSLCSFPFIRSISHRGCTIFKTPINENYYFLGDVPKFDPNNPREYNYYYHLIDNDRTLEEIATTVDEFVQELIKEMTASTSNTNSAEMLHYIYELLSNGEVTLVPSERKKAINSIFSINTEVADQRPKSSIFQSLLNALKTPPQLQPTVFRPGVDAEKVRLWIKVLTKPKKEGGKIKLRNPANMPNHTVYIEDKSYRLNRDNTDDFKILADNIRTLIDITDYSTLPSLRMKEIARSRFNFKLREILVTQQISLESMSEWQAYFTESESDFEFKTQETFYKIEHAINSPNANKVEYRLSKSSSLEEAVRAYMKVAGYHMETEPKLQKAYQDLINAISDNMEVTLTDEIEQNIGNLVSHGALYKPYTVLEYYNNPGIAPYYELATISNGSVKDPLTNSQINIQDMEFNAQSSAQKPLYAPSSGDIVDREFVMMYHAINNGMCKRSSMNGYFFVELIGGAERLNKELNRMLERLLVTEPNLNKEAMWRAAKECYAYGRMILELQKRIPAEIGDVCRIYGNYYMLTNTNRMLINLDALMSERCTTKYVFDLYQDSFERAQQKIDSLEIKDYMQYQATIYRLKMIMDAVWFVVLVENGGNSLMQKFVVAATQNSAQSRRSLQDAEKIVTDYHATFFAPKLAERVKSIAKDRKWASLFQSYTAPGKAEQTLDSIIESLANAYIPEYFRLYVIIMGLIESGNNTPYQEYYAQAGITTDPKKRFIESRNNYFAVKALYLSDPKRFIPSNLQRIICHRRADRAGFMTNEIAPLSDELLPAIGTTRPRSCIVLQNPNLPLSLL